MRKTAGKVEQGTIDRVDVGERYAVVDGVVGTRAARGPARGDVAVDDAAGDFELDVAPAFSRRDVLVQLGEQVAMQRIGQRVPGQRVVGRIGQRVAPGELVADVGDDARLRAACVGLPGIGEGEYVGQALFS